MISLCRHCGFQEHVAKQFVTGCEDHDGHEYIEVNETRVGPIGPGTPAARMRWLWSELDRIEPLLVELGGYEPFSSQASGRIEFAFLRLLKKVTELHEAYGRSKYSLEGNDAVEKAIYALNQLTIANDNDTREHDGEEAQARDATGDMG
jgi:hypothetical protein